MSSENSPGLIGPRSLYSSRVRTEGVANYHAAAHMALGIGEPMGGAVGI
jgi:hypothetical protein